MSIKTTGRFHQSKTPATCKAVLLTAVLLTAAVASASTPIFIWKGQRVGYHEGYYFPVSVGHAGNPTPVGRYTVQKKVVDYMSRKYKRAMPYSVFFTDAHAIHSGDLYTESKGCVRVDRQVAMWLYSKAKTGRTKVIVRP